MDTFDFNHSDFKKHSKGVQNLLRSAYKSGMPEDVFVVAYNANTSKHQAPSKLRGKYRRLINKYQFF